MLLRSFAPREQERERVYVKVGDGTWSRPSCCRLTSKAPQTLGGLKGRRDSPALLTRKKKRKRERERGKQSKAKQREREGDGVMQSLLDASPCLSLCTANKPLAARDKRERTSAR